MIHRRRPVIKKTSGRIYLEVFRAVREGAGLDHLLDNRRTKTPTTEMMIEGWIAEEGGRLVFTDLGRINAFRLELDELLGKEKDRLAKEEGVRW